MGKEGENRGHALAYKPVTKRTPPCIAFLWWTRRPAWPPPPLPRRRAVRISCTTRWPVVHAPRWGPRRDPPDAAGAAAATPPSPRRWQGAGEGWNGCGAGAHSPRGGSLGPW